MDASYARIADPERLAAVREVMLVERPPGSWLDHLTLLACRVLHVPTALVSFVDAEREVVESGAGLPEPWASRRELPLTHSYCKHLVAAGAPLLVEDARRHPRLRGSPAISDLSAVAYAGVPVHAPGGQVLGAFCVIDHLPRSWVDDEVALLAELAGAVQEEIGERVALHREKENRAAEARRIERELAEASRFRLLVESSLAGIYLLQGGRIVYANPRLRRLFGYGPDEDLSGRPITDFVAPEDRGRVLENVRRRVAGEVDEVHYAFRGVRGDGSPVEVEAHGSRTELGGSPAIIGTLLDVTERKRAEDALREAVERLRLVERATEDVIWEWDVRTGAVRWNEAGPRLFRYRPAEVGATIDWHQEHIHPEDRERVIRSLQAELGGVGEVWSTEYRFRRGDGQYATVLDRGCVVRDERGEPVRVIGSMVDVTERKREEEAQRFLSRASFLLDSSLDPDAVLPGLARLCVPLLGDFCLVDLAPEDEPGGPRRAAAAHVDPQKESALAAGGGWEAVPESHPVRRVLRTGEPVFVPECDEAGLEALGYGAEERVAILGLDSCSVMVVPLAVGERRLGAITLGTSDAGRPYTPVDLLLAQDVAHRVALAVDHARLYCRATEAVRARDEMFGIVTHDLRNPLNAILMSTAMLRDRGDGRRPEDRRWLDAIVRTAQGMNALIGDLLDVSSIEVGRFSVSPSGSAASGFVRDASDLLRPLAEDRGIRLDVQVEEGLSTLWIDARQVLRVISNLVGNAVKFTPEGGRVQLRVESRGEEVLFSVCDTGRGIPREHLPHIFDRYWQGRPGDRRGAGLGLAIAKGIVEAHGGRIWVESAAGEGTTVRFTVPAGNGPGG